MRKKKPQKTAWSSRSKDKDPANSSAGKTSRPHSPPAKTGKPSKKRPPTAKGAVNGPGVRRKKTKSESARDILDNIASSIEAVPPPVRDAVWSVLEDLMKPKANTHEAQCAAASEVPTTESLSLGFFSPSLDEAQNVCESLFGQNFAWSDVRKNGGSRMVSVHRLRTEYAFTHRSETAADKVIAGSDLVIFGVDGGAESPGGATVSSYAKVSNISKRAGVPLLVLIGNSEAILTSTQEYRESEKVRVRWIDLMRKRSTKIVGALGCAPDDAVVMSLPLMEGITIAVERMLTKLPNNKRLLLLAAISENYVPEQFRKAPPKFYKTIQNFKRTLYQGASHSLRYLVHNPAVRGPLWKLARRKPLTEADYEVILKELGKAGKNFLYLKRIRARINDILRTCDFAEI